MLTLMLTLTLTLVSLMEQLALLQQIEDVRKQ